MATSDNEPEHFAPPARRAEAAQPQGALKPAARVGKGKEKDVDKDGGKWGSAAGARYDVQFYRTKLCAFWEKGKCTRRFCKYAHGEAEIHIPPNLTKTALCRTTMNGGKCTVKNCNFAHNISELRATGSFYKTTMCCFHRVGNCKLGSKCRHAHSTAELRPNFDAQMRQLSDLSTSYSSEVENDADDIDAVFAWERTATGPAVLDSGRRTSRPMSRQISQMSQSSQMPAEVCPLIQNPAAYVESDDEGLAMPPIPWDRMHTMPAALPCMGAATAVSMGKDDFDLSADARLESTMQGGEVQLRAPMMPFTFVPVMTGPGFPPVNRSGSQGMMGAAGMPGVPMPSCSIVPILVADSTSTAEQRELVRQMQAQVLEAAMPDVYED